MGSSFSNLDKSWGCTSFGASSSKSHRKESTGLCRCPKNYPPGYTLPSPSRTKTSSLPINEPSNCVITSLTSVNTYNCTCKSSVAHHHLNSDTHPSNTDSGFHSRVFNSQAFIPRDPSISVRVSLPNSISNREQLCTDQSHCLNGVGKCTNDNGARKKNAFTNLSTSTDYAIEQFRNLISSWSCNELCCLYLEYEALYEFQLLWKDAIKTRLRAPTLKDDLSSLAQHGWCFNIYLIHNDYAREAHSYILASRLSAFDCLIQCVVQKPIHVRVNQLNLHIRRLILLVLLLHQLFRINYHFQTILP
ncbi:unnamed protein product [Heterobilharzia americana]|nr:unnamed protein product [Heterobilharzia americana]